MAQFMHPGATEVHTLTIPFAIESFEKIVVTYKQDDYVILEKTLVAAQNPEAFTETGDAETKIEYKLTQEESLRLKDLLFCYLQVNVISGGGGVRSVSEPLRFSCGEQFHREVIS